MATKTVSLRPEAYEKLQRARSGPKESFSEVVMRARWDDHTVTERGVVALAKKRGFANKGEERRVIELQPEQKVPAEVLVALMSAVSRISTGDVSLG